MKIDRRYAPLNVIYFRYFPHVTDACAVANMPQFPS